MATSIRRGHPPIGYITASQAKKRLGGISDGKFRSYITEGKIERFIPGGMKQGFYKREDVEKLAYAIEMPWIKDKIGAKIQFQMATLEDIPAIVAIDEATFNTDKDNPDPQETYLKWIEGIYTRWMLKNPQAFSILRAYNKIVAFSCLLPIKIDIMQRFIKDEIKMDDIKAEDIDLFEPGKPLHVYSIALCVDPEIKGEAKEKYGARIISGLFDFLMEQAQKGVEIETITARNEKDKPDGRRLLHKLGIPQLRSYNPNMYLFSVKVADSGYQAFTDYYDILTKWKKEHSHETEA